MGVETRDIEELERVAVSRSLSMRQMLVLVFTIYFAGTGVLFLSVEQELMDAVSAVEDNSSSLAPRDGGSQSPFPSPSGTEESGFGNGKSLWEIREEQVKLKEGMEVTVSKGNYPSLSWAGDRYALVISYEGIRVAYSYDGLNWTTPVVVVDGTDKPAESADLLRLQNGTFLLFFSKVESDGYLYSLYMKTSEDGESWSQPIRIPTDDYAQYYVWGISAIQVNRDEVLLAFSTNWYSDEGGGGNDIMIMRLRNGTEWEGPSLARTPQDHDYPNNLLYGLGSIDLSERNGTPSIAHVDGWAMVWAGPYDGGGWRISQVTPSDMGCAFLGASIAHLDNSSTVVAFDHMGHVYLARSIGWGGWQTPISVVEGYMPSIASVGRDTMIVAYCQGYDVKVTLVSEPEPGPVQKNAVPIRSTPKPVKVELIAGGSWESDNGDAYIDGEDGLICVFDNVGHGVLQIDTGDSQRAVRVNLPAHQGPDGWLYGEPTLQSGLYDFNELQLIVGNIPTVEAKDGRQRPGSMTDMPLGVKLHCRFGLSLYDVNNGTIVAWLSHYDEDEWHWDAPEPDIYMIRESETQWRLINNGYINHWFEPGNIEASKDHPVLLPFELVVTVLQD